MTSKDINQLVTQIETHIECWKQFNHFISVARSKKFSQADDIHFLEIKSIIVQELELIFASIEVQSPTREEIHGLITNAQQEFLGIGGRHGRGDDMAVAVHRDGAGGQLLHRGGTSEKSF